MNQPEGPGPEAPGFGERAGELTLQTSLSHSGREPRTQTETLLLQEGGPLPGPEAGLLSNTRK